MRYLDDVNGVTQSKFRSGELPAPEKYLFGDWIPQRTAFDEQAIQVNEISHI